MPPVAPLIPRVWQTEADVAVDVHEADAPSGMEAWESGVCPMVVAGPGSGKTLYALQRAVRVAEAGGRVAWLAHRRELLTQPLAALARFWPHVRGGIVQGARDRADAQIVFASVDTLRNQRRREAVLAHGPIALVVVDEAHRSMSGTHQTAIAGLISEDTRALALTATPDRMDGADLGRHWTIVYDYPIERSIRDGVTLPPYAVHVPIVFDLDGVDEDDADALGDALLEQGIVPATVAAMQEVHTCRALVPVEDGAWPDSKVLDPHGRISLVFTASVRQARLTAEALTAAGIEARHISAETSDSDRARLIREIHAGRIRCLCNAMLLTEGTDIPVVSLSVVARPMRSWSLYVQSVTRSGRAYPGQVDNMIIDLAGASTIHHVTAAPVLIGGSACPQSADGAHRFEAHPYDESGVKGKCAACGKEIPCLPSLGAHDYDDATHTCRGCGRVQCEASPTGGHTWVPIEGARRSCIDCGVEIADPHAGLLRGPPTVEPPEMDWLRVHGLVPETYALDAGDHGILLVTGERSAGVFAVWWAKKGARKIRRIGPETVPASLVRAYATDIAARVQRKGSQHRGMTEEQAAYARQVGARLTGRESSREAAREIARARARKRAIEFGIAREAF